MAFEKVSQGKSSNEDYRPTKYIRYVHPEDRDLTEKDLLMKKDDHVVGYYLKSYPKEVQGKTIYNHVLVTEDNNHLVIPGNKDVTKDFQSERIVVGALTKFTYLGKQSFEYTDDKGNKGTAKAVKALIEQDKDQVVTFTGSNGCEVINTGKETKAVKVNTAKANPAEFATDSIPF